MPAVLNVGGGSKSFPIPSHYEGWKHDLLDLDPKGAPDFLMDPREMQKLPAGQYDGVYCSHKLVFYHRHDAAKVIQNFRHVLKPEGHIEIHVPDMGKLMETVAQRKLDIDDQLYMSPQGPILVRDVIYGHHVAIEMAGNDTYLHRTGYTRKALANFMATQGYIYSRIWSRLDWEVSGLFFAEHPTPEQMQLFGLQNPA